MITLKRIWITLLELFCIFSLNFGFCLPNGDPIEKPLVSGSQPIIWWEHIEDINQWPKTFTDRLWWILHLPQKNEYQTSLGYVLALIQISVNWLLWILSFIALVYMIYCGFLVFSSWSDDKNTAKGKKWISTAAIALAWIGLSWLIISAMIWFINMIAAWG